MKIEKIQASQTSQIRQEVMWPEQLLEFVQLKEDDLGAHYGVFTNEKLVSIVSCFFTDNEMQFRKLATLEQYQGQGIASGLLKYILNLAKQKGVKKVWCNARKNKKGFFTKNLE